MFAAVALIWTATSVFSTNSSNPRRTTRSCRGGPPNPRCRARTKLWIGDSDEHCPGVTPALGFGVLAWTAQSVAWLRSKRLLVAARVVRHFG